MCIRDSQYTDYSSAYKNTSNKKCSQAECCGTLNIDYCRNSKEPHPATTSEHIDTQDHMDRPRNDQTQQQSLTGSSTCSLPGGQGDGVVASTLPWKIEPASKFCPRAIESRPASRPTSSLPPARAPSSSSLSATTPSTAADLLRLALWSPDDATA